jgi:PhzF family phenazine biosynthesis protein
MKIYQVDAFTSEPFKGNPAGVCLLEKAMPDEWMRSLAMEMNLSETAFLLLQREAYSLRWFTPRKEVRLCGHATLATAHILFEESLLKQGDVALFDTLSGRLTARRQGDWIELDFPVRPTTPCDPRPDINAALGITPVATAISPSEMGDYLLLELASDTAVRNLAPDFIQLEACQARAVIVTSRSDDPAYDFVSRFFAPWLGINEDPVTGSAHCCLAPFWGKRLGRDEMVGYQASARGGVVRVRVAGDRVRLGGQAVTVARGELLA